MGSHEPFGHLQHKLWQKERSGVKLAIWLPTIKSWKSTQPRCVQVDCNAPLEISWGELQVCFKPHLNRRSQQRVMISQVPKAQTGTVLGLPVWSLDTKSHSDVGAAKRHRVYYMGEGDGFPWVRAVVNLVSLELLVACPSTKGAPECELTNLLVGLMQVRISKWSLSLFLIPSQSFNTPLYPF
jgi:hypothetical protein